MSDVPSAPATVFDTSVPGLLAIAGERLSPRYTASVSRFERGPGVFKVDWALSGPVPWTAEVARRAGTVHVGGTFEEIAASEDDVAHGRHSESPYCIVVQATVWPDATRAPAGQHTLWAYCHVPNGSSVDMTEQIERQIERFAPGFRDLVLARVSTSTAEGEAHNANYLGGDISGGAGTLRQTIFRPALRWERVPHECGRFLSLFRVNPTGRRGCTRYVRGGGAARNRSRRPSRPWLAPIASRASMRTGVTDSLRLAWFRLTRRRALERSSPRCSSPWCSVCSAGSAWPRSRGRGPPMSPTRPCSLAQTLRR